MSKSKSSDTVSLRTFSEDAVCTQSCKCMSVTNLSVATQIGTYQKLLETAMNMLVSKGLAHRYNYARSRALLGNFGT